MSEAANINTDTSIATGKVTTATGVTTDTSTTSMKPVSSPDDEKSFDDIPAFTPPLRIHATRVPERLSGSLSIPENLTGGLKGLIKNRNSARSGSRSPATFDGGSSISSLEDAGIDTDILTDKMGTLELDASFRSETRLSQPHLQTVAERMSEEMLEDCHAFTDLKRGGSASRGNSITTGGDVSSNMLEPLDEVLECEDESEGGKVKITNMEEILEAGEEDAVESPLSLPP
jgi:hypothetical protein